MKINQVEMTLLQNDEQQAKLFGINIQYFPESKTCSYHQNINGKLLSVDSIAEIYGIENVHEDCTCALNQVVLDIRGQRLSTIAIGSTGL